MIPLRLKWKIAQYLELRWWKNYLSDQSKTDYLEWKRNYWLSFLKTAGIDFPADKPFRVLDAGCGPAGIYMVLHQHRVDAVDPLLSSYESLPHFTKYDYPHVQFIQSKLEDFRYENEYDVVFCLNAINHVEDLKLSLQNISAALKSNGILFLSIDMHRFTMLKYLFKLIPGDMLHPHQFMLNDYLDLLKQQNFKIEKIEKIKQGNIFDYYLIAAKNVKE